jgi:hypothetical protein
VVGGPETNVETRRGGRSLTEFAAKQAMEALRAQFSHSNPKTPPMRHPDRRGFENASSFDEKTQEALSFAAEYAQTLLTPCIVRSKTRARSSFEGDSQG